MFQSAGRTIHSRRKLPCGRSPPRRRRLAAGERLLHPQRRHAVLVVVGLGADRPKAGAPIDRDRPLVVFADLQPQRAFSALDRQLFRRLRSALRPSPCPACPEQLRWSRAGPPECRPGTARCNSRRSCRRSARRARQPRAVDQSPKGFSLQPIGLENGVLDRKQGVDITCAGRADVGSHAKPGTSLLRGKRSGGN